VEDKLDIIIRLLTEINNKLTPVGPDVPTKPKSKRQKKLTEHQLFLQEVENTIARDMVRQQKRAEKMFSKERAEVEELRKKVEDLKKQNGNVGKK